jgi:hypothetical protein
MAIIRRASGSKIQIFKVKEGSNFDALTPIPANDEGAKANGSIVQPFDELYLPSVRDTEQIVLAENDDR